MLDIFAALAWGWFNPSRAFLGLGLVALLLAVTSSLVYIYVDHPACRAISRVVVVLCCLGAGNKFCTSNPLLHKNFKRCRVILYSVCRILMWQMCVCCTILYIFCVYDAQVMFSFSNFQLSSFSSAVSCLLLEWPKAGGSEIRTKVQMRGENLSIRM